MTTILSVCPLFRPPFVTSCALVSSLTACDGGYTCQDLANCTYPSEDGGPGSSGAVVDASVAMSEAPLGASTGDGTSATAERYPSGDIAASGDAGIDTGRAVEPTGEVDASAGTETGYDTVSSTAAASSEEPASVQTHGEISGNTEHAACNDESFWDAAEGECKPWSTCSEGTYVATAGTAASDRVCSDCPSQTFSIRGNVTECTPCNTCGWLGLEAACTKSRDAVCRDVSANKQFGTTGGDNTQALARDVAGNIRIGGWYSLGYRTHSYGHIAPQATRFRISPSTGRAMTR